MPVIYANRIIREAKNGTVNPFTIDDVPVQFELRAKTLVELASRGYDGYGNPLEN